MILKVLKGFPTFLHVLGVVCTVLNVGFHFGNEQRREVLPQTGIGYLEIGDHLDAKVKCHAMFLEYFGPVDNEILSETLARMAAERKTLKDMGFNEPKSTIAPFGLYWPLRHFNS